MTESSVVYLPSPEFVAQANVGPEIYGRADADRLAWWAEQARRLDWETEFTDVLDWSNAPFAKWFPGGKLNVAVNCVDRHVDAGKGDRIALMLPNVLQYPISLFGAMLGGYVVVNCNPLYTPRGDHHDARVRTTGRHPLGGLRRLLVRRTALTY